MASISHGMNVDVITGQVVPGLNREAQEVERTVADVDRLLQQVEANWKGTDAKQFQSKWTGQYRNQLKRHSLLHSSQHNSQLHSLSSSRSRNSRSQHRNNRLLYNSLCNSQPRSQ